jgi:Uma2 family endonuclease
MLLPKEKLFYTVEQYLEMERASEERHDYIDGYVYNMAGESLEHSAINANLIAMVVTQLRGKPCRRGSVAFIVEQSLQQSSHRQSSRQTDCHARQCQFN